MYQQAFVTPSGPGLCKAAGSEGRSRVTEEGADARGHAGKVHCPQVLAMADYLDSGTRGASDEPPDEPPPHRVPPAALKELPEPTEPTLPYTPVRGSAERTGLVAGPTADAHGQRARAERTAVTETWSITPGLQARAA